MDKDSENCVQSPDLSNHQSLVIDDNLMFLDFPFLLNEKYCRIKMEKAIKWSS